MENGFTKSIQNWLEKLEYLTQEKTDIQPQLNKLGPIKAVLWDIYGTLMISASGDIDKAQFTRDIVIDSLCKCSVTITDSSPDNFVDTLMKIFKDEITKSHREEKNKGNLFPEVDIIDIWKKVLSPFIKEGRLDFPDKLDFKTLAFCFELGFNRIGPMTNLVQSIKQAAKKRPMGIISNAQFYTPIIMNFLLSGKTVDSCNIQYFEKDLCFYSFQYKKAKPGDFLYIKAKEALENRGIPAEQTLYIGNDMLNDIWPAQKQGFKTLLYAGDKRSLRLRKDREEIRGLEPHGIITEVSQVHHFIKD